MGTLDTQPPRGQSLENCFHYATAALRFMGIPEDKKPTAAEWHAACDIVRTALAVQSADVLDEQLAGFGGILESIAAALRDR
jgi:hypothetical protein